MLVLVQLSLLLSLLLLANSSIINKNNSSDVLLSPVKEGIEVCLIIIQGADIPNSAYVPLAQEIQAQSPYKLWVGIPHFLDDTAEPLVLNNGITRMLSELNNAGMDTTINYFAGHSLGGAMVQLWTAEHPELVTGQMLLGSFLTRVWKNDYQFSYAVPTITIGGELDGLARVTRIAEAYYTQLLDPNVNSNNGDNTQQRLNFPVTVIEGLTHMQFASGEPPQLVHAMDLIPEISYDEAHKLIANDMVLFMNSQTNTDSAKGRISDEAGVVNYEKVKQDSQDLLMQRLDETYEFVNPIITALQWEGYHNFRPPCLCTTDICEPMDNCTNACPFTIQYSQKIMGTGDLTGVEIVNTDSFHDVWETKPTVHLPTINSTCNPYGKCTLYTTTITQGVYHTGEDLEIWKKHFDVKELDSGFIPITAIELRTKMISRQNAWTHAGVEDVDFDEVDGGDVRCGEINQESLNLANSIISKKTSARFYDQGHGQPLVIGADKDVCPAGPCWIWQELEFRRTDDKKNVELISPQFSTSIDFYLPKTAGFHYCKVLSPARAVEWMYVDGLRQFYSLHTLDNSNKK